MDFAFELEGVISLFMPILCGDIIGLESEYKNKSDGFSTIVLITLGSTFFTIVSRYGSGVDACIWANINTVIGSG